MREMGRNALSSAKVLAATTNEQRNSSLRLIALALRTSSGDILDANARDVEGAESRGLNRAMIERLLLDENRIEAMATGIEAIAMLPQSIGTVLAEWEQPNGLRFERVSVPLGVIGIIYESRPNVTADAAALCLKSGNAVILRGGSESYRSCSAIYNSMQIGLQRAGMCAGSVQMVPTRDRDAVGYMLSSMSQWLDVVVPRGGRSLIERVQKEARIPVIGHLEGLCHVYLHAGANAAMARDVVLNAKMRRTGICGAAETVLVDREVAEKLLPGVCDALISAGCEIRGDASGTGNCRVGDCSD